MKHEPLIIDYYSDILCVWAWIAQRRIDELNDDFGEKIEIVHRYVDVFGDVAAKIGEQWQQKGGYAGFATHVRESAAKFEYAPVNSKTWTQVRPVTSANAHLILKAIEITYGKTKSIDTAFRLRNAFFADALDIGHLDILRGLVKSYGLDHSIIDSSINDGTAMAALMSDYQNTRQAAIKGSPSYIINGGRQTLYGNVGYRVLHANVEELLNHPKDEASWC